MPLDTVGILTPIAFGAEQYNVIEAVAREVFVNEAPLYSRLRHTRATSETYTVIRYDARLGLQRRILAMGTGDLTNVATSLPMADASPFMVGDTLELADGTNTERVEVIAPPVLTTTPNTLTVRRAREGTTAAAFATATPTTVTLIGNSRTGGEINQQAYRPTSTALTQNVQTFQNPVEVGGKADAIQNVALPPGVPNVMGRDKAIKLVDTIRDIEFTSYVGLGEAPVANGDRAKQKGLRTLIKSYSGGVNVSSGAKTNYTRTQFIADGIAKIYNVGGQPDTILCSSDFLAFLDTWVPGKTTFMGDQKTTRLGFEIESFVVPLNGRPMAIVPSLQMPYGSAAVLSSYDLEMKTLREIFWQPRGYLGDAMQGDWIGDYCIHLGHPMWHAWIENIQTVA